MFKKNLILILIMSILHVHGMFIGQYATPYNVLNPILTQEYATSWPIVSELGFLKPATVAQLNDALANDCMTLTLGVGVYGQPLDGAAPDKTLNLVYHNLIRDCLMSTEGFNPLDFSVNAPIGIFEPNGITNTDSHSATIGALAPEAVIIHGDGTPEGEGQLYSPNNVRFKIDDERQVASFWSVAVAPDNQHAALNFNFIIFNQALADLLGQYHTEQIPLVLLTESPEFQQLGLSEADHACLVESIVIISNLNNSL